MKKLCALLLFLAVVPTKAQSAPDPEAAAIRQAALDYIEGWYEGDAVRMERALHPELAKRIVMTDAASGKSRLDSMSAMTLVQYTRAGGGKKTPKEAQMKDVTILDRYQNAAVVKVVATNWIDYLQVAKYNGDWKIVNVLWELKPKDAAAPK
jgi:Putative lumazine-binding